MKAPLSESFFGVLKYNRFLEGGFSIPDEH